MATGCCVFVGVGVAITQWFSTPSSRPNGDSIGARARRSGLGCSMRLCAGGSWPARGGGGSSDALCAIRFGWRGAARATSH